MSQWIHLCSTEDIPPDSLRAFRLPAFNVVVVRLQDSSLYALEDLCSHADAPLSGGWIEDRCLVCPLHGAEFDLATGEPRSLPATEPVRRFPVREAAGRIEIEI